MKIKIKNQKIFYFILLAIIIIPLFSYEVKDSNIQPLSTSDLLFDNSGNNVYMIQKTSKRLDLISIKDAKTIKSWNFEEPPTGVTTFKDKIYVTSTYSNGYITIIDKNSDKVEAKIKVGMGAISPVINSDGSKLYVCNQYQNTVSEVNLKTNKVTNTAQMVREPLGAVIGAQGKYLYVTNFLPAERADKEVVSSRLSVIDLKTFKRIKDIPLENGSNALRGVCLSPEGKYIFVSHNLGRFQVPTSQLQQGWMNTSAISVISTNSHQFLGAVLLDEAEHGAAGIWDIKCNDKIMAVSHSGTHDISIVNYPEFIKRFEAKKNKSELCYDLRFLNGIRKRIDIIGNGPRKFLLKDNKLVVPTYFSDSLNIVNLADESIKVFNLNPNYVQTTVRMGERFFNDATYCFQGWQSCNGCHPGDGRTDGLNWDLLNDGIGNPKNCKSMLYAHITAPAMISGIRPDAETAVRAGFKHIQFAEVSESRAKAVDEYLKSLKPLPSPYLKDGKLTKSAKKGQKVFQKAKCDNCHSGPLYTDLKMHKIGKTESDKGWDTPTLKEVWRTAPYLFDGSANTLEDLFIVNKHGLEDIKLKKKEIKNLIEFVNSL